MTPRRGLNLREAAELLLDFAEDGWRQRLQPPDETPVVDRAALVDHDLAVLVVAGDPPGEHDPQEVVAREPGRARQDPGGRVVSLVEQVGLNDEDRPDLSGLGTCVRAQVRKVERPAGNFQSGRLSAAR